jgi:hypothetical protein
VGVGQSFASIVVDLGQLLKLCLQVNQATLLLAKRVCRN